MKSIRRAHIVVVADSDQGLVLAARLKRMAVAQVTSAAGFAEARGLCRRGGADACIVLFDDVRPDDVPLAVNDAPGRGCGVPSLMVVRAVTPFVRKAARSGGYLTAVPASITPRMLYRRLGAALQHRRAASRTRPRVPRGGVPMLRPQMPATFGKPTLH